MQENRMRWHIMRRAKITVLTMLAVASCVALVSCGNKKTGFADMPSIDLVFSTNATNQAIATNVQATLQNYGITLNLTQVPWSTYLATRRQGDFTWARSSWIADYNDALTFLDMWTSDSGVNNVRLGMEKAATFKYEIDLSDIEGYPKLVGTWAETYDKLISFIKVERHDTKRHLLMHKAEDMLMSTGAVAPIYYYVDSWLQNPGLTNVPKSVRGHKFFTWAKNNTGRPLQVCLSGTPATLDPALSNDTAGGSYIRHMFAGLTKFTPTADMSAVEITPDLIEYMPEPQIAPDGKATYIFKLRSNARFSDGSPITAQDVVDSWHRAASYTPEGNTQITEAINGQYAFLFKIFDGYDSLNAESTNADLRSFLNVKALSRDTLKVVTNMEYPYFPELLAETACTVVKNAWSLDAEGTWVLSPNAVTSGAYTMANYTKDVALVVERNQYYWNNQATTQDRITFAFSNDESAMYGAYLNGDYLLIDELDKETIKKHKDNLPDFQITSLLGVCYYGWNVNSAFFDKLDQKAAEEVRYAISLLINRQYIVNNVTGSGEKIATGFVGAGIADSKAAGGEFVSHNGVNRDGKGYIGNLTDYNANVEQAMKILSKYYKWYGDPNK